MKMKIKRERKEEGKRENEVASHRTKEEFFSPLRDVAPPESYRTVSMS